MCMHWDLGLLKGGGGTAHKVAIFFSSFDVKISHGKVSGSGQEKWFLAGGVACTWQVLYANFTSKCDERAGIHGKWSNGTEIMLNLAAKKKNFSFGFSRD